METLIITIAVIIVLSLQLLLCLKLKNIFLKLIPATITSSISVYFFIMLKTATSWDALGYAVLWIISLIAIIVIAIAWIVYMLVKIIKRRNRNGN